MQHKFSLEYEIKKIPRASDTEDKWDEWQAYYLKLTDDEKIFIRQALFEFGISDDVKLYTDLCISPVLCFDQSNVNNGCGMMFSIERDFFPKDGAKLFYARSDMWISPEWDVSAIPKWINDMEWGCKKYSSGLAEVQTEVIQYGFGQESNCNYYAITFQLDERKIRKSIRIGNSRWWPTHTEPFILTIMDIMGEYSYAVGWIKGESCITLKYEEIDFS